MGLCTRNPDLWEGGGGQWREEEEPRWVPPLGFLPRADLTL